MMVTGEQAKKVLERYRQDRQSGIYTIVEIKPQHLQVAFECFEFSLPLKSADALHLGIARYEGFKLITLDVKQAKSAKYNKVPYKLL